MRKAFTLVELAIVIVIIGLLVGGVLAGQELIKQAQVRKFIKNIEQLEAAKNTFFAKYNGVPGDLRNATVFFNQAECEALIYGGFSCNSSGDNGGNGLVDGLWNSATSDQMRYFVHLRLSKIYMCPGPNNAPYSSNDYSYCAPGGVGSGEGKNVMVASTGNSFNISTARPKAGTSTAPQNLPDSENLFAVFQIQYNTWKGSVVDGQTAYSIDSKIDNGLPLTGKILAGTGADNSNGIECLQGTEYNMASDQPSCVIFDLLK